MTAQEFINMAMRNIGPICGPHLREDLEKYVYTMAPDGATEKHMIGAVSFVKRDGVWEMPR